MAGKSRITILGATGSIGSSTLDVIARNTDRYEVFALTALTSVDLLFEQCCQFLPRFAVIPDQSLAATLSARLKARGVATRVLSGADSLVRVVTDDACDTVMAAIVGAAGLLPSLAAARCGKRLLLANKESLVMSGALFMQTVKQSGALLLPIDSEHNAIFQCLPGGKVSADVKKLMLTASGGPLLRYPLERFGEVTPEQACAHPNWSMGRKISVDSATMMNKGLELIEASWLFDMDVERIEIVIHPESIIHSMVEYTDGSVLAQMGAPDMRTPIACGLAWPDRIESGSRYLDLVSVSRLSFEAVDLARFPCLELAMEVGRNKSSANSAVLNAANEIAVQAFLDKVIRFTDIPVLIGKVLQQMSGADADSIEGIIEVDTEARSRARQLI